MFKLLPLLLIAASMFVTSGCGRRSTDSLASDYEEQISKSLPIGTSRETVEEYFKGKNLDFTFEEAEFLKQTGTLNLHPEDLTLAGADFKGRYCVLVCKRGARSDASGIHAYVYIRNDGRVSAVHCRGVHAGP